MKLESPPVPEKTLAVLADGGGGREAMEKLGALQYGKTRGLVRGVVAEASARGHARAGLVTRAYRLLAELEGHAPAAVDRVLRYPAVGAWAWYAYRSLAAAENTVDPGRPANVALAAAIRARRGCRIPVPASDGVIMIPSLGEIRVPAGRDVVEAAVRADGAGVELTVGGEPFGIGPDGDRPGWRVLHTLDVTAAFGLVLDDLDPYRWPRRQVLEPRFTPERRDRWRSHLRDAWRVLAAHHPQVAEEIAAGIRVLTPIRGPRHGQDSATSRETFGTVALSDPPDGLWLAVTLAHEVQHAKLTALTDVVELFRPGDWPARHYAPWRDIPGRPMDYCRARTPTWASPSSGPGSAGSSAVSPPSTPRWNWRAGGRRPTVSRARCCRSAV